MDLRSIKPRRTKSDLDILLQACLYVIREEQGQITIRHLFYRLVGLGVIAKSESEYRALGRHLMKWRRAGLVPWSAFADNTRWYYGSSRFDGIDAACRTQGMPIGVTCGPLKHPMWKFGRKRTR